MRIILNLRLLGAACALALCFCRPTTADAGSYHLLFLDGHEVKWGQPVLGTEAVVTYALVSNETHFAGARNCGGIAAMAPLLSANHIDAGVFEAEVAQAFDAWQSVAGIDFLAGESATADILIGIETEPKGKAFTNVTHDEAANGPSVQSISRALICLNPAVRWKIGFDGNLAIYDLRYTLMHEIGHAIGLDHPDARGELMYVDYDEAFRTPQPGDISGAATLYGRASDKSVAANLPRRAFTRDALKEWSERGFHTDERSLITGSSEPSPPS